MEFQSRTLLDLNNIHREMHELFENHQVAILKSDLIQAKAMLKTLGKALFNHMREEDEILLPIYRQKVDQSQGDETEVISSEHKKITEWFNRITLRASRLSRSDSNWKEIIALFDDEAQFKKYMEQHSARENRTLYPVVDRLVEEKEKTQLCRLLTFSIKDTPNLSNEES